MGKGVPTSVSKLLVHLLGFRYRSKGPKEIGSKERQFWATAWESGQATWKLAPFLLVMVAYIASLV